MMKLATILLLLCLQVSARSWSQTINYAGKNVPIKKVFSAVKKQTGYSFFILDPGEWINRPVTLNVQNSSIEKFLAACLQGLDLDYSIEDKTIFIRRRLDPTPHAASPSPSPAATPDNESQSDIRGRVTNEKGLPLEGASVMIKNTRKGTLTDGTGSFELNNVPSQGTLQITYTGYQSNEIQISGRSSFAITLKEANRGLDAVQVIAYGTTTQRMTPGNSITIPAVDLEKQPVANVLSALAGRVPSLFVTQSNGLPGGGVVAVIQGQNSINSGNDPFYVIDGVPYTNQLLPNLANIYGKGSVNSANVTGNPLNYINPSDIESITVLKDADATAIYGSRAANGAILITTKKGKAGETKVDLNLQNGWGKVTRKLKLLNTRQYLEVRHEAIKNDGLVTQPWDFDINGIWDTTSQRDWQKILLGGTSQYTNLNGTVSGGNATTQYLIGGTYHRETMVFPGNAADQKGAAHFSINTTSNNQKFHAQLTGSYLLDNNRLPNFDLTTMSTLLPPDAPSLLNPDGSYNWALDPNGNSTWAPYGGHPLANLLNTYKNKTSNLTSNAILSYDFIKGLRLQTNLGYNNMQVNEILTFPLTAYEPAVRQYNTRAAQFSNNNINSWIIEPQLTYKYIMGFGKLEALVGTTIQRSNGNGQMLRGTGYNSDNVMEDIRSASSVTATGSVASVYKYNALFGRLNFNIRERYILDLTARRDGSSRFGPADQFHNFAAVAGAWIFSSEDFIKSTIPILSFGKIKASYGTTGNDQIGDYQFLDLYNPITVGVPYQGAVGLVPARLYNPLLQWEESKKINIGLDLGFFHDRILLNTNYFRNRSSNQLLAHTIPSLTGFGSIIQNFPATVQNEGWEFILSTTNFKNRSFQWSTSINLTIPRNKLIRYDNLTNTSDFIQYRLGMPITQTAVYHLLGVDKATGVYQFEDSHGNPTTTPGLNDLTRFVNLAPTLYGGIENNFTYKTLSLNILVQYIHRKGLNYSFGNIPGAVVNQPVLVLNRWRQPNDIAPIQKFNSDFSLIDQFSNARSQSDGGFTDASFARVKSVTLSWKMPQDWNKKAHIRNLELFLQGQNLFTITHYTGLDPETLSTNILPPLRIVTVGLQASL